MCLCGHVVEVRVVAQDAGECFLRGLALVWRRPGQHLVEDAAERPDVGPPVHHLTRGLLRRHVGRGAQHDTHLGLRRGHGRRFCGVCGPADPTLGETEVQHLDDAVRANLHVARLEVTMDDAALVRVIERINDLSRDGRRLVELQRPRSDLLCQRRPFHELHDEVVVTDVVQRADVGMIERGDDPCFAGETLAESFRRDLDGDLTRQARILRPVHLPHATHADLRGNLVGAEPGTWGKLHCAGDSTVRS